MNKAIAQYLAETHNNIAMDDIAHGFESAWRAKKLNNGQWCVWCMASDHVVEFDQKDIERAAIAVFSWGGL